MDISIEGFSESFLFNFNQIRNKKNKIIYDLIEESIENQPIVKENKIKLKKSFKNAKLFKGRNVIKKVKTFCLKVAAKIIKDCNDSKEKVDNPLKRKLNQKRNIYKILKSDISKFRNKALLSVPIGTIMRVFSNVSTDEAFILKEDKKFTFNYYMNSNYQDLLIYIKRRDTELSKIFEDKNNKISDVTMNEVNDYLDYIKQGQTNYKDRVNLDKHYIKIYENLIATFPQQESFQNYFDLNLKSEQVNINIEKKV